MTLLSVYRRSVESQTYANTELRTLIHATTPQSRNKWPGRERPAITCLHINRFSEFDRPPGREDRTTLGFGDGIIQVRRLEKAVTARRV